MTKNQTDLIKVFQNFLTKENLQNQKILLMVSGGVDSMVLLNVVSKVIDKKNIAVFHLNHNARKESKEDQIFVQNICSKLNIKFYSSKLPSPQEREIQGEEPEKVSNQESVWRSERKTLSQEAAKDFETMTILTAHHATDLVETMIFRLTKGCGVAGLSPFDISTKPFWQISKIEIIQYAKTNNLEWKEDKTNQNLNIERNLLRHKVLPELQKITSNLEKVFVRQSETFSEVQEFLDQQLINHCHSEFISESITLEKFQKLPSILQKEFLRKIAKNTPSKSEINDCLKWLLNNPKGNSGKLIGETKLQIKGKAITW